jgi:hypothetical protein
MQLAAAVSAVRSLPQPVDFFFSSVAAVSRKISLLPPVPKRSAILLIAAQEHDAIYRSGASG